MISLCLNCSDLWSFTVIFKDGRRIEGIWIGEDQRTIQIKDDKGVIRTFQKSQLDMKTMAMSSRFPIRDARENGKSSNQKKTAPLPSEKPDEKAEASIAVAADRPTTTETGRVEPFGIESPTLPKVRTKRFSLEAGFSSVYESNIHHDEEDIVKSVGVVPSMNIRFRNRPTNPYFLFRYEVGLHQYTNTDDWDRVSHNIRAAHILYLGKNFLLESGGEISLNGSSEDRERSDTYGFRPVLAYYINNSIRLEAFAAYRHRKLDTGTEAINRYAGFGFIKEWKEHEIEGYYRYEYNNSENFRSDRYVSTYHLGYGFPVTDDLTASLGARLRSYRYLSRLVDIEVEDGPDIEFLRRDKKWNFKFALEIPLGKRLELVPEYEYEIRNSNDPEKHYDAHGAFLTLVYSLW